MKVEYGIGKGYRNKLGIGLYNYHPLWMFKLDLYLFRAYFYFEFKDKLKVEKRG